MIKSIELVNWKTHRRTVMNFQKGVNVLIGVMGAGKSSVIDGISFGLFGTSPSLSQRRTTTENMISNRPSVENEAEVIIKFTVDSDEYLVSRRINRDGPTSAKLEKNGKYIQTQSARVNEEIESLIKVDYDTFSRAIYAEQNRIDYFLELTRNERKKQIDQMLGLDSFATAEANATSLINSIKSIIAEDEKILAQVDSTDIKSQLEKLTKEKQTIEKEQMDLAQKAKEKEQGTAKLEKELAEIKSRHEKNRKLEKEIAELSSRSETLKKELKKIEETGIEEGEIDAEFKSKSQMLEECDSKIKQTRKKESEALRILADSEATLKVNEKKFKEREKFIDSIKGKNPESINKGISEKDNNLQNAIKELSSLKGKKDEIKEWARELGKHISKCPVCERELDEQMRALLLEKKNGTLKEIDSQADSLSKMIGKLERELADSKKEQEIVVLATSRVADYKDIDELIAKASSNAKEQKSMHDLLVADIEKLTKEREALSKKLSEMSIKIEALKRKGKYEAEIKDSNAALESKKKELADLNFNDKQLYSLQELITKESAALSEIKSKIKSNERYGASIDVQVTEKAKILANLNLIRDRIEVRRTQISNMNKFRNALVETEAQLRNRLVGSINSLMQSMWVELYPYADYSGIRLNAKKDDYSLEASTGLDGSGAVAWIEIDSVASGGERSVASLTLRIALAMVIVPNLRWLILDEPTHNIDENGIGKFIEVLGNSLPKVVEQIFIITHDNALKGISSARIYQLERNKDRNEYTSVVEL